MSGRASTIDDWRNPALIPLSPVLAGGLAAFYEHGYHGSSMRDIARGAEMTVPGIYYHYKSKQAILADLLDHSISAVIELSRAAVAAAGDDPVQRFDNLVEALIVFVARHPKNAAMDGEIRALTADNRRRYSAKRRVVERMLIEVIEDGVRAGSFRVVYSADTARALLGMIQSIPAWFRSGGRLGVPEVARRYLDVARNCVGAEASVSVQS